jgi:hypothetical protein
MWVSSVSIPAYSGGEQIALDDDASFHRADQAFIGMRPGRQHPGERLAALGDDNAARIELLQDAQALGFEFGGADGPILQHAADRIILTSLMTSLMTSPS